MVAALLLQNFLCKIPSKNEQIVRLVFEQFFWMVNREVVTAHKTPMLNDIQVDKIIDPGNVHHSAGFGCRSIPDNPLIGLLYLIKGLIEIGNHRLDTRTKI